MRSRSKTSLLGAAGAALLVSSATAPAAPIKFDCDSFDGAVSEVMQTQGGPNYALKAQMTAMRLGKHRQWLPNAMLQIFSADGKNVVAIRVSASSAQSQTVSVTLSTTNNGEQKSYSVTTVKLNEAVDASIVVRDGKVQVQVAGQSAEAPIAIGPDAEVRAACSTGEFMFEKLEMAAPE
jgi:hypothetical protein